MEGIKERIEAADRDYNANCTRVEEFDIADLEDELDRLIERERDMTCLLYTSDAADE